MILNAGLFAVYKYTVLIKNLIVNPYPANVENTLSS